MELENTTRNFNANKKELDEVKADKRRVEMEIDESQKRHIKKLETYIQPMDIKVIREEMQRTYIENEERSNEYLKLERDRNKRLRERISALRKFNI